MYAYTHIGFVSNGEFNYLRTKGYTRPLSVLKIRVDVRNKYNRLRHSTLLSMLTPKCEKHIQCTPRNAHLTSMHMCTTHLVIMDGSLVSRYHVSPVPASVLREIHDWMKRGITMERIIKQLRQKTVTSGYTFHTWKPGPTQ